MRSLGVDMDDKDNVSAMARVGVGVGHSPGNQGRNRLRRSWCFWLGFVLRITLFCKVLIL